MLLLQLLHTQLALEDQTPQLPESNTNVQNIKNFNPQAEQVKSGLIWFTVRGRTGRLQLLAAEGVCARRKLKGSSFLKSSSPQRAERHTEESSD